MSWHHRKPTQQRLKRQGFSLIEAIFASFLLLTALLLSVQLFDTSLQAEANNEQRIVAALVAENVLDQIRSDANSDFGTLQSAYDGRNWSLPEYSNFQIEAKVEYFPMAVPCSELESQYSPGDDFPLPNGRYLSDSVWKVQIDVDWPRSGGNKVTIVEYLSNLEEVTSFQVAITPNPPNVINASTRGTVGVPRNDTRLFNASATANGESVNDVQFSWYVEPLDGFGSVHRVSRDGKKCLYKNAYRNFNNHIRHSPGQCNLVLRAEYQGIESIRRVRILNAP